MKPSSKPFYILLALLLTTAPVVLSEKEADNKNEGVDGEDASVDEELEVVEEAQAETIPINLNMHLAPKLDCEGLPDGLQPDPDPQDCGSIYMCIEGKGHRIECPKIDSLTPTYYNPQTQTCGVVAPDYCLTFKKEEDANAELNMSIKSEL